MQGLILASFLVVAASATILLDPMKKFHNFKIEHGKSYGNREEETNRFNIFKHNLLSIERHNALYERGLKSYKQGINEFSDTLPKESRELLSIDGFKKTTINVTKYIPSGNIPDSVDWRTRGQVTEVRSQKKCRAGWAFAIVGSAEAAYYRKSGQLVVLSEQQLVDCVSNYDNGCGGGYNNGALEDAFPYIIQNGLQSGEIYPYTARDDGCKYIFSSVVTNVTNYVALYGEDDMLDAVANVGPVAVGLDSWSLYPYESGIYTGDYSDYPDHTVLIVGYGSENGTDYWIAKNSWGPKWGENGYFRIRRGTDECCLGEYASVYPIIY